jgi:hypothetical protein
MKLIRDRCKVIYYYRIGPHIYMVKYFCAFPHILGRPSLYMISHLNFLIYEGNFVITA